MRQNDERAMSDERCLRVMRVIEGQLEARTDNPRQIHVEAHFFLSHGKSFVASHENADHTQRTAVNAT